MNYKIAIAGAALCLGSTSAFAQDSDAGLGGFHAEGLVGYDRVEAGLPDDDSYDGHEDGVFYGAAAGYDIPAGVLFFGVEAEIAGSTTGSEETVSNLDVEGYILDGTLSVDSGMEYYLGGRIGSMIGDRTAIYFKGGWAMSSIDIDADGTVDGTPESLNADIDVDGFRFGAGVEQSFGKNTFAKLEYRYTNFAGGEVEVLGESVNVDEAFDFIDLDRHQVALGLGIRF